MAAINWPDMLPKTLLTDGLSKQPRTNVIRTAMDAGPAKTRRRYTAAAIDYSGKQILSPMELAVFEQFYHTALADGALRFNFTDPVSLETDEFRFTGDYSVVPVEGFFEVTMPLERL